MSKGKLYIVPINISESPIERVLPDFNKSIVSNLRYFVVEKIKTSRQFLRKMDKEFPIDDSYFFELDKHHDYSFQREILDDLKAGNDFGLMSEAGYPGIADPGSEIVSMAQFSGIEVIPLVGPSSILMALAASGMNGNGFTFNGYLPKKDPERSKEVKEVIGTISKTSFAQIFIETPYRNETIFEDFLKHCPVDMKLCVAYDVTGPGEKIITKSIEDWRKGKFEFDKTPCVFVVGQ
ncbi:MAG: 16S rRNA (cytidine1402-2'-O)-methyltransferase [Arenicella sp.]|jgi:16S rRNA (cytidine1402-2'-O)-methyltransferase